ncbi:MAG: bifunctional pyr operon transcriptional regulator/uracil phosphoribosyltransferase PyrR [Ignavibacteriales bacterium]|nr:bifunctional pyr operon transcriptional regulator/uracil phosphoribosyltransferase PyrR [Ignavibacteriales bacterium]
MKRAKIIDATTFSRTVNRVVHEILERNKVAEQLALVGIRNRGQFLARRLAAKIKEMENIDVPVGILDITLYRDDLHGRLDQPKLQSSEILFDISGKVIVLVDDVLFTGRTVRSALNALMDIGRPALIQLLVLIDRGHRELPIKADFIGKSVPTAIQQEVQVMMTDVDEEDAVYLNDAELREVKP